jgi:hypothetical protein
MAWIAVSPFYLVGVIFILMALINTKRAKASLTWPSAQGRITSSQVAEHSDEDYGDSYRPKVEYEYGVAGRTYSGKRIAFGPTGSLSEARVRATAESYKVGTTVEVFYNPARPDDATLERRATRTNVIFYIFGVAFILFGIAVPLLVGPGS